MHGVGSAATRVRPLVLLVAAVGLTAATHARMDTAAVVDRGEIFVPEASQVRLSTLGFDALLADYYWLQAVQIVGGETMGIGRHSGVIARLVDVVTTLNPWVDHPYRFAAVWLTEDVESVLRANELLERGIAYHPNDWRNRHYLGFNHFYYLGDDARAADVIETAVGLPRAPRYLGVLVAKLRTKRDGLETSSAFLTTLIAGTDDGYAKAEYLKALDEVETERAARRLDAAREEYRRRNGRDIEAVSDLLAGAEPVLWQLPPAHPHFPGFEWVLHEESGVIVSSFYGARYEPRIHRRDRERRERWRRIVEQRKAV